MKIIGTYLLIGVVFTALVDISTEYARRKGIKIPNKSEWNNEIRLLAILIWPIGLLYFINGFIKTYFDNNKNK